MYTTGLAVPQPSKLLAWSLSLPDICTESSEYYNGLCNSGSDTIINVHCSGENASQAGEFIINFQILPIHSGSWFSRLLYDLCLFVMIVRS